MPSSDTRELLEDPDILSTEIQINRPVTNFEGVGVIEAPRWHALAPLLGRRERHVDRVNMIVATGNNNFAMSKAVDSVAKTYVDGNNVTEGALNRIEAAIRAYDPCLSCSTHAIGQMPLELVVYDPAGNEVKRIVRG